LEESNIKAGDLVRIKMENLPTNGGRNYCLSKFPLCVGRVVKIKISYDTISTTAYIQNTSGHILSIRLRYLELIDKADE